MIPTVEWKNGKVRMIDQTRLPGELIYNEYADYRDVTGAIRDLVVRGAPAIGVSAAHQSAPGPCHLTDRAGIRLIAAEGGTSGRRPRHRRNREGRSGGPGR